MPMRAARKGPLRPQTTISWLRTVVVTRPAWLALLHHERPDSTPQRGFRDRKGCDPGFLAVPDGYGGQGSNA